jgi:hypothetical protein
VNAETKGEVRPTWDGGYRVGTGYIDVPTNGNYRKRCGTTGGALLLVDWLRVHRLVSIRRFGAGLAAAVATLAAIVLFFSLTAVANAAEDMRMDMSKKGQVLTDVLRKLQSGQKVEPAEFKEFGAAQNDGMTSGLGVGTRVPDFALPDQDGKEHSLRNLMGPNGLLLVFSRSADW